MQEDKPTEVMNTLQMQIPQESRFDNPVRTSTSKALCSQRNRRWQAFQLMMEDKSIEVMNSP
jgi:hypothetical protein